VINENDTNFSPISLLFSITGKFAIGFSLEERERERASAMAIQIWSVSQQDLAKHIIRLKTHLHKL
jgi:hypothetical protein